MSPRFWVGVGILTICYAYLAMVTTFAVLFSPWFAVASVYAVGLCAFMHYLLNVVRREGL